jgi:CO/xanthine dehydrogenase FAD-binding subunit
VPTSSGLASDAPVASPSKLDDALLWLTEHPGACVLAGGTDVMVQIEAGALTPREVLNIWGLDALRGVRRHGQRIWIGALTTYAGLIRSEIAQAEAPSLVEAARTVGARQIQNRGTLGGNIANASPTGDTLPVLLSLDAVIEVASAMRGPRFIPLDRMFLGARRIALEPDELITGIWLSTRHADDRTHYRKVGARMAQAISKVVLGARVRLTDGVVREARIALGSVGPVPLRCENVEAALVGAASDPSAAAHLRHDIAPIDDIRSTASYRGRVAQNILRVWLESLT